MRVYSFFLETRSCIEYRCAHSQNSLTSDVILYGVLHTERIAHQRLTQTLKRATASLEIQNISLTSKNLKGKLLVMETQYGG